MDPRWRRVRRWHRLSLGMWLGWLPYGAVMIGLGERALPRLMSEILIGAYMLAFVVSGGLAAFALCPACGNTFGIGGRVFRFDAPWAPRCRHCGAKIGEPLEAPKESRTGRR